VGSCSATASVFRSPMACETAGGRRGNRRSTGSGGRRQLERCLAWGATFSAVKRYANGTCWVSASRLRPHRGTAIIPFPIVTALRRAWLLRNPLAAGPTGPAGSSSGLLFDTVDARLRDDLPEVRFRLSDSGPTPNGVGEFAGVPVFLRASQQVAKTYTLNLYAGVVAGTAAGRGSIGQRAAQGGLGPRPLLASTSRRF